MICNNCKGRKIFKNLSCWCKENTDKKARPDCTRCGGTGTYDSQCSLCNGSGETPDIHTIVLINADSGAETRIIFDLTKPLDEKLIISRKNKYPDWSETIWYVDLARLFTDACGTIAVSEETHFMLHNNAAIEFGWSFGNQHIARTIFSRKGVPKKPLPTSSELNELALRTLGSHFSWYSKDGSPIVWKFVKREPTCALLDSLYALVSPRGYSYEFRVTEGNIATGESGWGVWLTDTDGEQRYAELSIDYTLPVAVQNALLAVPKALDRADARIQANVTNSDPPKPNNEN